MKTPVVLRFLVGVGLSCCVCSSDLAAPLQVATPTAALTARDSAFHALSRLAYGPRPGDVERLAATGVMSWIDRQLAPERIDDRKLAERERQFTILDYDRGDLAAMYVQAQRERRERKRVADAPRSEEHTSELQSRL